MGQQQLLLLVLATVIVGLATTAGIKAYEENRTQATKQALINRATSLMSMVRSAVDRPESLAGVDLTTAPTPNSVWEAAGIDAGDKPGGTTEVGAPGASEAARCDLSTSSSGRAGNGGVEVICDAPRVSEKVIVNYSPGADPPVKTTFAASDM